MKEVYKLEITWFFCFLIKFLFLSFLKKILWHQTRDNSIKLKNKIKNVKFRSNYACRTQEFFKTMIKPNKKLTKKKCRKKLQKNILIKGE